MYVRNSGYVLSNDFGTSTRLFAHIPPNAHPSWLDVYQPDNTSPANKQSLALLVTLELLLPEPRGGLGTWRWTLCVFMVIGLHCGLVNPLEPCFPGTSHSVPFLCLRPINVAMLDTGPGILRLEALKMKARSPYPNSMLVCEGNIFPGEGPLNGRYSPLSRVEYRVLPGIRA